MFERSYSRSRILNLSGIVRPSEDIIARIKHSTFNSLYTGTNDEIVLKNKVDPDLRSNPFIPDTDPEPVFDTYQAMPQRLTTGRQ